MPTSRPVAVVARLRARLREEDGYTLIELLTVLILMGIVLGAVVVSFTVGIHARAHSTTGLSASSFSSL